MKKLFATALILICSSLFAFANCDGQSCPGASKVCCKETTSFLWGLYESETVKYSNRTTPTSGEPVEEAPTPEIDQ